MDIVNLKGKTVLVTGGNGFLGGYLLEALLEMGALVISIDKSSNPNGSRFKSFVVDILNEFELKDCIQKIEPQFIFHLAASLDRTRDFEKANTILEINLKGTINLLNALKTINYEKIIYISTSEVYGGSEMKSPFKEESNFIPASPYALSKYCAEMAVRTFSEIYVKNYTILRLFNFFGNSMPKELFLAQLIEKLRMNQEFNMTKGEQIRDYVYVKDVVNALLLSASNKANNMVLNVCSGNGISIKEMAYETKNILKSEAKINLGALEYRTNEVWEMIGDAREIEKVLGWRPEFSFTEGLKDMIQQ